MEETIAGAIIDDQNVLHGHFRQPDGTFVVIDAPGAGTGPFQGTDTDGINDAYFIPRPYYDSNSASHGYIRFPDGSITEFDVPGAGTAAGQGTLPPGLQFKGFRVRSLH